jgi:hypothetical protein
MRFCGDEKEKGAGPRVVLCGVDVKGRVVRIVVGV